MTSYGLSSLFRGVTYEDFSKTSSIAYTIYKDFGLISSFDNGVYFNFELKSEFLNRNGDFSLISTTIFTGIGDMSITSYYKTSYIGVDFGIFSKIDYKKFTSFGNILELTKCNRIDFSIDLSFAKTTYNSLEIKSIFKYYKYSDFYIKSNFIHFNTHQNISYGLSSSFRYVDISAPPITIDLSSILWSEAFTVKVSSGELQGILFNIGNLSLSYGYSLVNVTVPLSYVSVVIISEYSSGLYSFGRHTFIQPVMIPGGIVGEFTIEYENGELQDLYSSLIEVAIRRDIVDFEDNLGEHLSLDIQFREIDVRNFNAEIKVPFANILKIISTSYYYKIIELPTRDNSVKNSFFVTGMLQNFYINTNVTKFIIHNLSIQGITFENISTELTFTIEDFSNIWIKIAIDDTKIVNFYNNSKFINYITLTNYLFGDISNNTRNVIVNTVKYLSTTTSVNVVNINADRLYTEIILKNISESKEPLAFIVVPNSCHPSGVMIEEDSTFENIFMDSYVESEIIHILPFKKFAKDLEDGYYNMTNFVYTNTVNLNGINSKYTIVVRIDCYDSEINFPLYPLKPILLCTMLFGIVFVDSFTYKYKDDLMLITSKTSNFKANIFFNGSDLLSENILLSVVIYEL